MRFKGVRAVARAALAFACGALMVSVLIAVPGGPARAGGADEHEPGLYLALGSPTRLMRGTQGAGGALEFGPVGSPSGSSYNALAAHLPDRALYAIGDPGGELLRVLDDGTTRAVAQLGASSVVGAFADDAFPDRLYYVPRGTKRLAWVDVVTRERGETPMDRAFAPVDMAWSRGYFWGLRIIDRQAVLSRLGLDGRVEETVVPAVDGTRFGSGSFGGAWTYGNGNLGFLANSGGAVQLRLASVDPVKAELVGYADSPASNNLDAALIPAPAVHLSVRFEASWGGPRTPMELAPVVRNDGATASSGYQLEFSPEGRDSRAVDSPEECAHAAGRFLCAGGPLQPGEERRHGFMLSMVSAGSEYAPRWVAAVQGNEADPAPVAAPSAFPAFRPTPVVIDTDVKARVVDARREGTVTVDKPVQVFVLVRNRGASPLSGIRVSIDYAPWKAQTIDQELQPGELRTVRFDGRVEDLMVGGIARVSTTVTADIDGAKARVQSKMLPLSGEGVRANSGGRAGPQPGPVGNIDPLDPPPPFVILPEGHDARAGADGSGAAAGSPTSPGGAGGAASGTGGARGAGGASAAASDAAANGATGGNSGSGETGTGSSTGSVADSGAAAVRATAPELSATGAASNGAAAAPAAILLLLGGGALAAAARHGRSSRSGSAVR